MFAMPFVSSSRAGRHGILLALTVGVVLAGSGCSKNNPDDTQDAGGPPPNACATSDAALSNPQCALVLGQTRTDYIRSANDQVWLTLTMPANTNPLTLVHLTAGYSAPSTPVNLAMNILQVGGGASLGRVVDNHQQGAPRPLDSIIRFTQPNARLLIFFSDQPGSSGRPNFDARNPFIVKAEVINDPDINEPNDITPTPIPLTNQGGILVGSNSYGYLATNDDVDKFSVTLNSVSGRKVFYLHIGTSVAFNPPPNYRMTYALFDPMGNKISEDNVPPEGVYAAIDLATARLLNAAGTYVIDIRGYKAVDSVDPVPGDVRVNYSVDVKVLDDADVNEPNDTLPSAKVVSLGSVGSSSSAVGRLGYVADQDWFEVDLGSIPAAPTLLHYRLRSLGSGGRFPPLPKPFGTPLARQVRVFSPVTDGATLADRINNCKNNPVDCPKGYEPALPRAQSDVEFFCTASADPVLCLQGLREESVNYASLKNFEGMVHVPPSSPLGPTKFFFVVRDAQDNWADDVDYQLEFDWLNDPDEATFYSGSVKQAKVVNPFSSTTTLNGAISYGYGKRINYMPINGDGVRGPNDYDSIISDTDSYEFDFQGVTPPLDRAWELQWQVTPQSPGVPSYELTLDVQFCDGDSPDAGSGCVPVTRSSSGAPLKLAYKPGSFAAWHNPGGPYQPIYDRAADLTTTARDYGCFCFEPKFVRGGKFFVKVSASDRNTWTRTQYRLTTNINTYPQSYAVDGGTATCPAVPPDGGPGCMFTRQ